MNIVNLEKLGEGYIRIVKQPLTHFSKLSDASLRKFTLSHKGRGIDIESI